MVIRAVLAASGRTVFAMAHDIKEPLRVSDLCKKAHDSICSELEKSLLNKVSMISELTGEPLIPQRMLYSPGAKAVKRRRGVTKVPRGVEAMSIPVWYCEPEHFQPHGAAEEAAEASSSQDL